MPKTPFTTPSEHYESASRSEKYRVGRSIIALALLISFVTACGIPDLKPFSDATVEMATQLRSAFEHTQVTIGRATATAPDGSDFQAESNKLQERWDPTKKAIAALVDYSDSLAALAEAGKNGTETVARLTDSVNELATAVGALSLTGTAAQIVTGRKDHRVEGGLYTVGDRHSQRVD